MPRTIDIGTRRKVNKNAKVEVLEYRGFKPFSYQRDVIDLIVKDSKHKHRTVAVKSRRQVGKSRLIENLLLYAGINWTRSVSICVSPTLGQARKLYKEIMDAISASDIVANSNATLLEIKLKNQSEILFKSAEQGESLRGFTVTGLLCIDEASYISDDVYYTILPWCDVSGAPKLIVSTPRMKSGFFYTCIQRGLIGNDEEYYTVDWCDPKYQEDLDKLLPAERLEEYRRMLPSQQFKSEYLGQFLDDEGVVFTNFKNCTEKNEIKPTDQLYWGIDWGNGGGDDTVLTAVNQDGKQVFLQWWNNLTPNNQVRTICELIPRYAQQTVTITPELNSIGTPYTDMVKERLGSRIGDKIQGFVTTNKSKNDLVSQLQVAFEQGHIKILPYEKQLIELGAYAMDFNPKTKTITYNAPQGLHDDICIGLMLAWDGYLKSSKRGNYCISVV